MIPHPASKIFLIQSIKVTSFNKNGTESSDYFSYTSLTRCTSKAALEGAEGVVGHADLGKVR